MAYIYDPSQQISQSLGKTAAGVGNIFSQVIAGKQQDFALAQEAEANIQALKKNLNQFSQENITNKSNALLNETRSSIFKNGKLDYSKLREIRNKITDIADLKQGYEAANQEFERRLQLGIANKDDMLSFTNYYSDLAKTLSDEDLIKRPKDLSVAMDNAYYKNLDANKVGRKIIGSQLGGTGKVTGVKMGKDKDGKDIEMKYVVDTYNGFKYNPETNKMEADPNTDWDAIAQRIEAQNPEYIKSLEVQFGAGTSFMSKGELIKNIALQTAGMPSFDISKSATDIESEKNKLLIQSKTIKKLDMEIDALKEMAGTGIIDKAKTKMYDLNLSFPKTINEKGKTFKELGKKAPTTKAKGIDFGKGMQMSQDGRQMTVLGVAAAENGALYAKVIKQKEDSQSDFYSMAEGTGKKEYQWVSISDPDQFRKSIESQVADMSGKDAKANILGSLYSVYQYGFDINNRSQSNKKESQSEGGELDSLGL